MERCVEDFVAKRELDLNVSCEERCQPVDSRVSLTQDAGELAWLVASPSDRSGIPTAVSRL